MELNVRLVPVFTSLFPVASVANNTLHVVSDDSSARVTFVATVAVPVRSPVTLPVTLPVKFPTNVEATKLFEPIVHLSLVSSQRRVTFASSPLSISIPAFSEAEPVALEFKTMVLSSTVNVSVDNIV